MVGLTLLTGLSRSEPFALRWKCLDHERASLTISEGVYEGHFASPKTAARVRQIPLCQPAVELLLEWKAKAKRTAPEDLIFSTRSGKPISPNNILRRFVFPACEALGLPHATWLTFRRTYSSWAHDRGVLDKVLAGLMGHSRVYTTLNVYTQVMDNSLRAAADRIGDELFGIVRSPKGLSELTH